MQRQHDGAQRRFGEAFSLKDNSCHDEFEISDILRPLGWTVLAYSTPPDAQGVTVLRRVKC
ncbi:hypothetical protein K2173_024440 [Erythroxylum novogranatense]|uniref:Uncharacterized protein n=1 Tax=Erythroxylum novogranatense TaxID=1862640 RepID=A0AAV8SVE1_9ROSI|nr:hypothetical protein K2173_024440 [Erythroxylum novogranatense]